MADDWTTPIARAIVRSVVGGAGDELVLILPVSLPVVSFYRNFLTGESHPFMRDYPRNPYDALSTLRTFVGEMQDLHMEWMTIWRSHIITLHADTRVPPQVDTWFTGSSITGFEKATERLCRPIRAYYTDPERLT